MTISKYTTALFLGLATAGAGLFAAATPVAAQQKQAVNGRNVEKVYTPDGTFSKMPDGRWSEFNAQGNVTYRFNEIMRDDWSVYLDDPSRNVQLQLDLHRKMISYGERGGPRSDLYPIVTSAARPVASAAQRSNGTRYASYGDSFLCSSANEYGSGETDAGPGQHFVSIGIDNPDRARVQYNGDEEAASQPGGTYQVEMISVRSGSGAKYAGGKYEFHSKGDSGILSYDGKQESCSKYSDNSDIEEATANGFDGNSNYRNAYVQSWGGKLRAGPGMGYRQVGSLYEGAPVTLLEKTDVVMNNYPWFKIRTSSGQQAYQWGGILCSTGLNVVGIAGDCGQ